MHYVIDRRNRAAYTAQIEEMYRLRHRIYVKGRGWSALAKPDGREIDQFDTDDAVYLLGLDEDGRVQSGVRLVPTTGPHLMRDVFPHALSWGRVPNDERIYEFTRYFLTQESGDREERRRAAGENLCALFEFGLARGLTHISLVCDTFFMPSMLECGFKVHPLGLPTPYDEGTCIAVIFEVSEDVLRSTRCARGVRGPVLTFSPLPPPNARAFDAAIAA